MVVVTHYCISANINGVNIGKEFKAGNNPLFAMLVTFAGGGICTAQIRTANTAHIAVVKGCGFQGDLFFAGFGHAIHT